MLTDIVNLHFVVIDDAPSFGALSHYLIDNLLLCN